MNEELYTTLKKYESYFYTAVNANYIRGLSSTAVNELANIYLTIYAKKIGNKHCNSCVLEMVKYLGNRYYEFNLTKTDDEKTGSKGNNTDISRTQTGSNQRKQVKKQPKK